MPITPHKLRAVLVAVKAMGLSPSELCEGSGTDWAAVRGLEPMSADEYDRVFRFVIARLPQDAATQCGRHTRLRDFGLPGNVMALCGTIGEALQFWSRFAALGNHPLRSELHLGTRQGEFRLFPNMPMSALVQEFCLDYSIASFEATYRELSGVDAPPLFLSVPRASAGGSTRRYDAMNLQGRRYVDDDYASLTLNREDLEREVMSADLAGREAMDARCKTELASITKVSIRDRVDSIIIASREIPSIQLVADQLGMSAADLRKALDREGHSYFHVVDEHRQRRARSLLDDGVWLHKEICYSLGYTETGSLRRAVRRWSRMPATADAPRKARSAQVAS